MGHTIKRRVKDGWGGEKSPLLKMNKNGLFKLFPEPLIRLIKLELTRKIKL
jgi:hypothetical protein